MLTWLASRLDGELANDEVVDLYPALAWRAGGGWRLLVRGCVYEPSGVPGVNALVRRWLKVDPDGLDPEARALLRERLAPFLVDKERGKKLRLRLGGIERQFRMTGPNGHFTGLFRISARDWEVAGLPMQGVHRLSVGIGTRRVMRSLDLELHAKAEGGWSVVSDVDDTVKVTGLADRREAILNTFARPFTAVPGMPGAYQAWARGFAADWHYLTGSPWQLFGALERFRVELGFPPGTWHMQEFRAKDRSVLRLLGAPAAFKFRELRRLVRMDPLRRFVLVGDSGQGDPEIYGRLARAFPGRVAWVWIRRVPGGVDDARRCERALGGGAVGGWGLFEHGDELMRWKPA